MHDGCILCGDVGSGKTYTAIQYYLENHAPKNVFVITTAKVRDGLDWEHAALQVGITPDAETTLSSVITVDSWNNIGKYTEVEGAFFIFDEQRVVGSGAWVKAFYEITKRNAWIILSATPGDVWLDYAPVFIANGFYKNITQFRTEHVEYVPRVAFPKVKRYHKVGKLVRLRNQILVDMPFERHTERVSITVPVTYDKELLRKVVKDRWHVYENRPLTAVSELFAVMRKVVNSDTSRIQAVESLLQTHPKLIVFYNHNYELEILRTLGTDSKAPWNGTSQEISQSMSRTSSTSSDGTQLHSSLKTSAPVSTLEHASTTAVDSSGVATTIPANSSPKDGLAENLKFAVEQTRLYSQKTGDGPKNGFEGSSKKRSTTPLGNSTNFSLAEWNGHKHEPIPKTDRWVYLVQYRAGAEGWNCIETDAMCFYTPTYSYRDDHQAHGRIDRLTTSFSTLYYYRLLSEAVTDKWVMEALSSKKSFNEAAIRRKMQGFADLTDA
jgi:hypothetical protein